MSPFAIAPPAGSERAGSDFSAPSSLATVPAAFFAFARAILFASVKSLRYILFEGHGPHGIVEGLLPRASAARPPRSPACAGPGSPPRGAGRPRRPLLPLPRPHPPPVRQKSSIYLN